jgi:hypothetical protein
MTSPDAFDPARLTLPTNGSPALTSPTRRLPGRHTGREFVKGPIPLAWLARAARLPGKALAVGVVLWHLVGLRKSCTVKWAPSKAESLGVRRHAAYRAQRALEKEGLISVERKCGRCPVITILVLDGDHHAGND